MTKTLLSLVCIANLLCLMISNLAVVNVVLADEPPVVSTNDATNITCNSATLNGYLHDLGDAMSVNVSFEWGTDDSYGNETEPQVMNTVGSFSADINDLEPDTTYHFRAKVVGSSTAYGEDKSFSTGICVCGFITEDTTWTLQNSPYVVTCGVILDEGVSLTIEPGVVVKFNRDKHLLVRGELVAIGDIDQPVTFTSCGEAEPGYWAYILFDDPSEDASYDIDGNYIDGCILRYCLIQYGGGVDTGSGAVRIENSSPLIELCTLSHNANNALVVKTGSPEIINNIITENAGRGIYIYLYEIGSPSISGNRITYNSVDGKGGGIYCLSAEDCKMDISIEISGNTIERNTCSEEGGGIYNKNNLGCGGTPSGFYQVHITGNVITENTAEKDGGGIYSSSTYSTKMYAQIFKNAIVGNTVPGDQQGSGAYLVWVDHFEHNVVTANCAKDRSDGASALYVVGNPLLNCNNIYGNCGCEAYCGNKFGADDVDATNNWWGTADTHAIEDEIWHYADDPNLGIIDYIPHLKVENICGDVDGDGMVTMNDGRQIFMNLIYGPNSHPLINPCGADCDGDPGLTMNDGRQIFMNLIYGPEKYPLQCS